MAPPAEVWANISSELDALGENKTLSAKINSLKATPPANLWDRIATELTEAENISKVSSLLYNREETPPAAAWDNIANELNDQTGFNGIAEKLANQEVLPPVTAWDRITNELDDQQALETIEKKLVDLQINPPASAWLSIRKELENKKEHQSLVVPMHHGWLKYAAAACFVAIISVTAFFILSDNDGATYTAGNSTQNTNAPGVKNIAGPQQANAGRSQEEVLQGIKTSLGNAYSVSIEKNKELQNRYIILMTQDGNVVRMSKKVSNMADCIAGEDHSCDDQISKWQKEMASSSVPSSPDNFLDILDLASEETGLETNL
ncbi:hypothetical protein [Niabella ginsengisoli]|uniref:Anti-sigma factor n=1 Tax=Niabella ginsengisoli TaxID=522298 RepID=A0ABS9SFQ0_9BACT|nr:hypothetical protein [Niabella ginsengisoli]MCH5597182.1 hypothetical protein [Niabella ginsengisoli]